MSHSQHPAELDDDALLVLRVGEGDVAAYRELVKRYAAKLSRFAERLLRDGTEAEDVVQETFLRLWQRAGEYQPKARVTTWLHRITHNLAVDRLRARGRTLPLPEEEEMPVSARQSTLLDEKRRVVALEAALAALPERQATAIVLVHNHPSGDPTPSRADIEMTKQIVSSAKNLGIVVHDHIIVGKQGHASFRGLGLI